MPCLSRSLGEVGAPLYRTSELPAMKMIIRLTSSESMLFGVIL